MAFDLKPWLTDQPFEISAWAEAVGIGPLVSSTIVGLIDQLAPALSGLSPAALESWKAREEVTLATAQWVTAGTNKRADAAIARGQETPFGKALAGAAVLHDARIRALIADNSRTAPKSEKE